MFNCFVQSDRIFKKFLKYYNDRESVENGREEHDACEKKILKYLLSAAAPESYL